MSDLDPVALTVQALGILEERMVVSPEELPSGALLRLAETLMKVRLAELASRPPETDRPELTVTDILAMDGLPRVRKLLLLREQNVKLAQELVHVSAAINELESEDSNGA